MGSLSVGSRAWALIFPLSHPLGPVRQHVQETLYLVALWLPSPPNPQATGFRLLSLTSQSASPILSLCYLLLLCFRRAVTGTEMGQWRGSEGHSWLCEFPRHHSFAVCHKISVACKWVFRLTVDWLKRASMGSSASGCQSASAGHLLGASWVQVCSFGVQAKGTGLGHVLMVSNPKRTPSLFVQVPLKADPETKTWV